MNKVANRSNERLWMFLAACAVLVTVFAALGCNSSEKEKEPIVLVQVTPAKRSLLSERVSAEAVISPRQQAVLIPKITSTIKKFLVQRGSRVHKGQLLAVLENADLTAAAEQSKGELEQAQAGYATTTGASIPQQIQKAELDAAAAKASFDAQKKVYDSRKELFQQGALPRRDLDSADVALAQARTEAEVTQKQLEDLQRIGEKESLKSAAGQLSAAHGKYLGANAQLSYSEIRSPIDGVVTDRPQYEGELATANQPLLTVMDTSKLIAKAHIAQSEAASLKVGSPAEMRVAGLSEPIEGKVSLVSPALDPGSTTIEVWVESKKPNEALKPGMTIQLSITARSDKNALVVPASAVFKNDGGADYIVLAGADDHAHFRTVNIGIRNAELVQITEGVKDGDLIITSGGYALPDKTQIKIETNAGDRPAEKPSPGSNSDPQMDKE
ncbi:MAG: efflux RND transporter periplasmic adaptor subunit [Terriglobales bacterium]